MRKTLLFLAFLIFTFTEDEVHFYIRNSLY